LWRGIAPPCELAGNFLDAPAEEVFDLSAGDDHCDAVGKPHDHRTRREFHGAKLAAFTVHLRFKFPTIGPTGS
jgi:hypothetical protein